MVFKKSGVVGAAAPQEMKIAILGAGGRLGAALAREWTARGEMITGFNRAALDLSTGAALKEALSGVEFDALVNCAAVTQVDYCESHRDEAFSVNGSAPGTLAEICESRRARFIHISTDYVFDGRKRTPYSESDSPGPLGVYAESKLAGERAVHAVSEKHLVARVSWVFGPDRPSFVDQILDQARETENLSAIGDKWAVPSYTLDLAAWLHPLLHEVPAGGTVHLCNEGGCTWQEYGQWALDCAHAIGAPLRGRNVQSIPMNSLKAFVAPRPVYTVMSTARLTALIGLHPRPWQQAVEAHVKRRFAGA
jgi:dTDP-4-dehydrorhamnose reductase